MSKKGFTLIEMVVVIGIIVIFCGFSIVTIATIPQVRMKKFAEDIKSNFELARDFSKTHGGTISLYITKTENGLELKRDVRETNKNPDYKLKAETIKISDNKIELFYQETNSTIEKRLGDDKNQLEIQFSQTDGSIIGPDFVDYMTLSNGNKVYKLIVMQDSGQVYFDYELKDGYVEKNTGAVTNKTLVELPCFLNDKMVETTSSIYVKKDENLSTIQPKIKYDSRYIKIGGVYRASEPSAGGNYKIYFDLKDPNGCCWDDTSNSTTTKVLEWNIVD